MSPESLRSWSVFTVGVSFLLLLGGCCNINDKASVYRKPWEEGQFQQAADKVDELANACVKDEKGEKSISEWDRDSVFYLLEQGAIHRSVKHWDVSTEAFDRAIRKIEDAWNRPELVVTDEIMAALGNQGIRPYDGYAYDHVMALTYRALNAMAAGKMADASVSLFAAEAAQKNYCDKRSTEIKERKEKIEKEHKELKDFKPEEFKTTVTVEENGKPVEKEKPAFDDLKALTKQYSQYTSYRNPFTTWLYGLSRMTHPDMTNDDRTNAKSAMDIVLGMVPENKTVLADKAKAEAGMDFKALPPTTYLVYEKGLAPIRGERVIWIPIPTGNPLEGHMTLMKLAFPTLVPRNCATGHTLRAHANGTIYETELLASMDGIIAREFEDELPLTVTRSIISGVVKAGVTAGAVEAVGRGPYGGAFRWLIVLLGGAYQELTTRADLRQWATLPKEFQVCSFPTPADRMVTLELPAGKKVLKLPDDGSINMVYVKSLNTKRPDNTITPEVIWISKLK
ncbi:MAG: hypothetical protein WCJ97_05240 [Phycisphaerae bacterium]